MTEEKEEIKPEAVAVWDTDRIEYGTLTFSRTALGRWTPILTIYTYVYPLGEALLDFDDRTSAYKHREIWLDKPEDETDLETVVEWDREVGELVIAFYEACRLGARSKSWHDAQYFNGGKTLHMTFTKLQEEAMKYERTREQFIDRAERIIQQEKIERTCDVEEWVKTATKKTA